MDPPATPKFWALVNVCILVVAVVLAGTAVYQAGEGRAEATRTAAMLRGSLEQQQAAQLKVDELSERLTALESALAEKPDVASTAKAASKSVFTVTTDSGTGSGFVVVSTKKKAKLVTNFHVVAANYISGSRSVTIMHGRTPYDGRIVDVSESDDLALIAVQAPLPALKVADYRPAVGDPVLVLGSPLGLGGTVTSGIVSAFRNEAGREYLQFSAPISPGNSGGPVIDDRGNVVGVSVAKMIGGGAEGLSFAVPAGRLCASLHVC